MLALSSGQLGGFSFGPKLGVRNFIFDVFGVLLYATLSALIVSGSTYISKLLLWPANKKRSANITLLLAGKKGYFLF